ncbi:MAG: DUF5915 domain-containing protein, partial [Patescibacteria group bacterium]
KIFLDNNLTEVFKEEWKARVRMRQIQDLRKERGLAPSDRITLTIATNEAGQSLVEKFQTEIIKTVGADSLSFELSDSESEFKISF